MTSVKKPMRSGLIFDEVDYILPLSVWQITAGDRPDVLLDTLPLQTWVPSCSMDD